MDSQVRYVGFKIFERDSFSRSEYTIPPQISDHQTNAQTFVRLAGVFLEGQIEEGEVLRCACAFERGSKQKMLLAPHPKNAIRNRSDTG